MPWEVHWEVIGGPFGARRDASLHEIWAGERLRFTLRNSNGTPQAAAQAESWARLPWLVVRTNGGQVRESSSSPADPLRIEQVFDDVGVSRVSFRGTPANQMVRDRDGPPPWTTARSTARPLRALLFEAIGTELTLRVMSTPSNPRGAEALTTRAPISPRREEARRVDARERQAVAREEANEQAAMERGIDEQIAALGLDEPSRTRSPGVFRFRMKTEQQINAMGTIEEVEDYLTEFRHAFLATLRTNPLRFTQRRTLEENRWQHYRITSHWVAERSGRDIEVYQRLVFTRTSQQIPPGYLPPNWEDHQQDVRRRTSIRYQPDEWLVADVPGRDEPALLTAGDLLLAHDLQTLWTTLEIVEWLGLLFSGGLAAPAVAARRAAFRGIRLATERIVRTGGRQALRRLATRGARRRLARQATRESAPTARRQPMEHAVEGAGSRGTEGVRPSSPEVRGTSPDSRGVSPSTSTAIVRHATDVSDAVRWSEIHATGLTHTQVTTLRRLINRPLSSSDLRSLGHHWHNAMAAHRRSIGRLQRMVTQGESHARVQRRARSIFGRIRRDFWRAVEADGRWRPVFEQAGISFPGSGRSPTISMNTLQGRRSITIDIGHEQELSRNVLRGFTQHNMTLQFQEENRQLLNQLMAADPFLDDARTTAGRAVTRAGRLRGMHEAVDSSGHRVRVGAPGGLLPPPRD